MKRFQSVSGAMLLLLAAASPARAQVEVVDVKTLVAVRDPLKMAKVPVDHDPDEMCFYATLVNKGKQPVRVMTLRVGWNAAGREIDSAEVAGPKGVLLPGAQRVYHFRIEHRAGAPWTAKTPFRITPTSEKVELDPKEHGVLQRRAKALAGLRGLNARILYQLGVPWEDEFTILNSGPAPVENVRIHFLGYDRAGNLVLAKEFHAERLDRGTTRVRIDVDYTSDVCSLVEFDCTDPRIRIDRCEVRVVDVDAELPKFKK